MIHKFLVTSVLVFGFTLSASASINCGDLIEGIGPVDFAAELNNPPQNPYPILHVYHQGKGDGYLVKRGTPKKPRYGFGQNGGVEVENVNFADLLKPLSSDGQFWNHSTHNYEYRLYRGLLYGMMIRLGGKNYSARFVYPNGDVHFGYAGPELKDDVPPLRLDYITAMNELQKYAKPIAKRLAIGMTIYPPSLRYSHGSHSGFPIVAIDGLTVTLNTANGKRVFPTSNFQIETKKVVKNSADR